MHGIVCRVQGGMSLGNIPCALRAGCDRRHMHALSETRVIDLFVVLFQLHYPRKPDSRLFDKLPIFSELGFKKILFGRKSIETAHGA